MTDPVEGMPKDGQAAWLEKTCFRILWLTLLAAAVLWPLGLFVDVQDPDEAAYAEVAREMLENGDWTDTRANYWVWWGHPIFSIWVIAAFYRVFGVVEWAGRLPAALEALAIAAMIYVLGKRLFGRSQGALAAALFIATPAVSLMGHNVKIDMNLLLLITATVLLGVHAVERPWLWIPAGLLAGLGMLTKGPIALGLPGLVVLITVLWERKQTAALFKGWRWWTVGLALCLAMWGSWSYSMYLRYGWAYVDYGIIENTFGRFSSNTLVGATTPFHFLGVLAWAAAPVVPGAVLALVLRVRELRGTWRKPPWPVLDLVWTSVPFVILSFSGNKLPHYIFPILPGLCIMAAHALVQAMLGHVKPAWFISALRAGTLFYVVVGIGFSAALITVSFPPAEGTLLLGVWLVGMAVLVVLAMKFMRGDTASLVLAPCLAAVLAMGLHNGAARPELARFKASRMVAQVMDQDDVPRQGKTEVMVLMDGWRYSLSYYGHIKADEMEVERLHTKVGTAPRYLLAPVDKLKDIRATGLRMRVRGFAMSFRTSRVTPPFAFIDMNREEQATPQVLLQVWKP